MSRLVTYFGDRRVVISEHGYFEVDGKTVAFEELPGIEYSDFNGWCCTDEGKTLTWDGLSLRRRIRNYLRGHR